MNNFRSTAIIIATILFATIILATSAFAGMSDPCDPRYHFISSPDCTTIGERILHGVMDLRQHIAEETVLLARARKRFFDTYPNKPGAAAARAEFWERLANKDLHYLFLTVSYSDPKIRTALTDPSTANRMWDLVGGKLDNGIPQSATPEFFDWAFAVQQAAGGPPDLTNALSFPGRFSKALDASEKKHQIYLLERDWAEFDAAGREPAGMEDPAVYFPAICVRFQKVSWDDAIAEYDAIVKALGKDAVHRAVRQVHAAPKGRDGRLVVTEPDPVKRGPGGSELPDHTVPEPDKVIGVTSSLIGAVEQLATQGDDRSYLLWLFTDLAPRRSQKDIDRFFANMWPFAEDMYRRYVNAFGETAVLEAAHKIRTAVKRATDGKVMDPKAIGSTRMTPYAAFEDVLTLNEPRGYVRALLAFSQKLDSTEKVDEAYRKFLTDLGPSVTEKAVLETAKKMATDRPEPTDEDDLKTLKNVLAGSETLDKPVEEKFDYPKFIAWKGFPPGSKASYAHRYLSPSRIPGGQPVPGQVDYRESYTLQSITAEQALLYFTERVYDSNGTPHEPRDREIGYPAKVTRPKYSNRYFETPLASGEETLTINGRSIATRWRSVATAASTIQCSMTITKTWESDEVPNGLVRETVEQPCGKYTSTREKILESYEGIRQPGVTNTMTAPPPPPPSAPPPSVPAPGAQAQLPVTPAVNRLAPPHAAPAVSDAKPATAANPSLEKPYPPNPEFPNFYLTEREADKSIASYCQQLYDPAFPYLSQEQVTFVLKNRAAVADDVRTCISWFDVKQMMADRKIAMRFCLVNNDFTAKRQGRRRIDYDACMNQNDVITALCTQVAQVLQELNSKRGFNGVAGVCHAPVPVGREALVVKYGGNENFSRPFVIPATGPGLPAILKSPLPPGIVRSEGIRQPGDTNTMTAPPPPPPSAPPPGAQAQLPVTPAAGKGGPASPAAAVNPAPEKRYYPPNSQLPNYYLTEMAAGKSVASYCRKIYDPTFPLLSQEQVTFVRKNRAIVEADVKTCISWFDVKQVMADRKVSLRYCLVNNDFTAIGQVGRKIDYDACMNQNDVITALCTQEANVRQELMSKKGFGGVANMCRGPVPSGREALVVKQGGNEDLGRPIVIPATGPGLPAILQSPLPPGIVRSGIPLSSTP